MSLLFFFSTVLSSRQLTELARDCEAEADESAKDMPQIKEYAAHLQRTLISMRSALGTDLRSQPWPDVFTATPGHGYSGHQRYF